MFVVLPKFKVDPARVDQFLAIGRADAESSVRDEPGCRQFDVAFDPKEPGMVWFYEVYDDEAAFEAHKRTPHFKRFDEESAPLVVESEVRFLTRSFP